MDRPPEIPTLQKYVENGGKPELYPADLKKLHEQHEAFAMEQARAKAGRTVRVRVTAKGWPGKQTHYRVPAKVPYDPRLKLGDPGYEAKYIHEPALSLPIGRVSEVPIRDERHYVLLKADVNLEFVDDDTLTHQEEQVVVNQALDRVRQGKSAQPAAAAPAPARPDIFQLEERPARELVDKTTDLTTLADWHIEAEKRGAKPLATAIVDQLIALHGRLTDLLDELAPAPPKPAEEKPTRPAVDPTTALAGAPGASPTSPHPPMVIVPPPLPGTPGAQADLLQPPATGTQAPPKLVEEHKGGKGKGGKG
jgi:hypothetical protein